MSTMTTLNHQYTQQTLSMLKQTSEASKGKTLNGCSASKILHKIDNVYPRGSVHSRLIGLSGTGR